MVRVRVLDDERQFRRVKAYRHLPLLKQALHRTLPTTTFAAA